MHTFLIFFCISIITASSASAIDSVTCFRDGTLYKKEAVAVNGKVELLLPGSLLKNTLSVFPAVGTTINWLETDNRGSKVPVDKSFTDMAEQKRRLEDRLQALDSREAIFTAAAKSQSGKAPRPTKANPDPMKAIRQGTEYAITQLEAVYTARRRANQEIEKIGSKMESLKKGMKRGETPLRISISPKRGKVTIIYATGGVAWQPQYTLELLNAGCAKLRIAPHMKEDFPGYQTRISMNSLEEGIINQKNQNGSGNIPASYCMPLSDPIISEGIFNSFSGTLTNSSSHYLPDGEVNLLRNGTYFGKLRFEGISSGRSRKLKF